MLPSGVVVLPVYGDAMNSRYLCIPIVGISQSPGASGHWWYVKLLQAHAAATEAAELDTPAPSSTMPPFHLAFPVADLDETRTFYGRCIFMLHLDPSSALLRSANAKLGLSACIAKAILACLCAACWAVQRAGVLQAG